jgi:hypothetical protein
MTDHLTHLLIHVNKRLHNFRLYIFTSLYYLKVYYKINCVDFNKVLKFNFILEITQA